MIKTTKRLIALTGTLLAMACAGAGTGSGQSPVAYRLTFPEPEHHWMQVEVTFTELGTAPLQARMSRSSPGRYAVHEFAKNIFSVEAFDGTGAPLPYTRPTPYQWTIADHDGTVKMVYKIFGDRGDGTYFAVDTTHARLNIPASFMWGVGMDARPASVTFVPPPLSGWTVGTQLFPTDDQFTFTAPNLQYLMDSPTELSNLARRSFTVSNPDGRTFDIRLAVHHDGSDADLDALAHDVERIVHEQGAVFGEFPEYDTGNYTFLLDYTPHSDGDGMEHRNSTFTSRRMTLTDPEQRQSALGTISHEFFHSWNVERIRPTDLEPFDFTDANMSCCLWLAEGFTQYYGNLLLVRSGLVPLSQGVNTFGGIVDSVVNRSGRLVRSPVEMSRHAPYTDAAAAIDKTDFGRSFISYYTYGAGVALALDLSLRQLSDGALTLDDYMRMLWTTYGKPAPPAPGVIAKPYTLTDLRDRLADLTNNRDFADQFFDRYVEGRDAADYTALLSQAGLSLQPRAPGTAWLGNVRVVPIEGGLVINPQLGNAADPIDFGTPAYEAGLEYDDVITAIDGQPANMRAFTALSRRQPGDSVQLTIQRRANQLVTTSLTLGVDPALILVPVEEVGGTPTDAQLAFRTAWLGTRVK